MNYKIGFLNLLFVILCLACATKQSSDYYDHELHKTDTALAEASYAVSRSLVDLAEMAQADTPPASQFAPPSPKTYGMGGLTTIDWSGPVEPLMRQIAKAAHYQIRILGRAPAIPILITIARKNVMLGNILRDVGYQCNKRAKIIVFPEVRVIELRYAKN